MMEPAQSGEQLYAAYRTRHRADDPPTWEGLGAVSRAQWSAWAAKGGRCQTGIILRHRSIAHVQPAGRA